MLILLLRDDRAKLQVSKVYPNAGEHSSGALLKSRGCPCGRGAQGRHHLLWRSRQARLGVGGAGGIMGQGLHKA